MIYTYICILYSKSSLCGDNVKRELNRTQSLAKTYTSGLDDVGDVTTTHRLSANR